MQRMDARIVKPGSGELFDVFSPAASCHSPIADYIRLCQWCVPELLSPITDVFPVMSSIMQCKDCGVMNTNFIHIVLLIWLANKNSSCMYAAITRMHQDNYCFYLKTFSTEVLVNSQPNLKSSGWQSPWWKLEGVSIEFRGHGGGLRGRLSGEQS